MEKFRVELWRVIKFMLITAVISLFLEDIGFSFLLSLSKQHGSVSGNILSIHSSVSTIVSTVLLTIIHRYFTFRATEKCLVATASMIGAVFAWNFLYSFILSFRSNQGIAFINVSTMLKPHLWFVISYLLQRCVIYCHTTDTNGWYRRFHTNEKERPYE